jgi:TP53 regulating kinase and related kinases
MSSTAKSCNEDTEIQFDPSPQTEWILISQGAEARVWKVPNNNNGDVAAPFSSSFLICKERFAKAYRHPDLDARLTKSRCRSEARLLEKCVKQGLSLAVPKVVRVEPPKLYLEYLEGVNLKTLLQEIAQDRRRHKRQRLQVEDAECHHYQPLDEMDMDCEMDLPFSKVDFDDLAKRIGQLVGNLHKIDIVHGDLTTSNIMIKAPLEKEQEDDAADNKKNNPADLILIDFGLGKSSSSVEEHAVDLYVLERALQSTHPELPTHFMDRLLEEYANVREAKSGDVLRRLEEVQRRGRKRDCFG